MDEAALNRIGAAGAGPEAGSEQLRSSTQELRTAPHSAVVPGVVEGAAVTAPFVVNVELALCKCQARRAGFARACDLVLVLARRLVVAAAGRFVAALAVRLLLLALRV